ncbi:hypothetical protein [Streptomyces rhizosphaericus]|uniref:hypothetical protein n=1 Tax=Streptomyces rhizosphaericus TaxID=114699 RepID=UPI000A37195D|nr:hypothetical protein [Streptomyces rhizosphaericus]
MPNDDGTQVEVRKLWAHQAAPKSTDQGSIAPEPASRDVPEPASRERFLVFAGAAPAARCALGDEDDVLRLIETAGPDTPARYGVPKRCPASGRSPLADAEVSWVQGLTTALAAVLEPPHTDAWPEPWHPEQRSASPETPIGALPTLRSPVREGRTRLWPAGSMLEPGLAGKGGR